MEAMILGRRCKVVFELIIDEKDVRPREKIFLVMGVIKSDQGEITIKKEA